ncbi:MAG TPA: hypothetical protein VL284_01970 [Thermoanaerobaculia bacterium]|nr:hypothetical protein [Thermoanaerobaculia bacterium]
MKRIAAVVLFFFAASASAQSFHFYGDLSLREIYVKSQPSWTQGGFGRFDVGADNADDHRYVNVDVLQVGADWTPMTWLVLHADGLARKEQSGTTGRRAGLVQAYADLQTSHLRLRAGLFWLPTSRENVDPLWTSRYTITDSALNTWIGEEFRPIGADLQWSPNFYFTVGATAFRGNDTMGTLLAARGWTLGNRLTVYDETIAAVPDTTRPIGSDLDHRFGDSGRIRVQLPERALIQVTHVDNRAKLLLLNPPDTPWHTKFDVVSGEVGSTSPTTLVAEWARGTTEVGFPGGSFLLDFNTAYVLLSEKIGTKDRVSARIERFATNAEHGHAWTVAWLTEANPHLRSGVEYVHASGNHNGAPDPRTAGSTITLEVRYRF